MKFNTNINDFSTFLAASILCDGEIRDVELFLIKELAKNYEFNDVELLDNVKDKLETLKSVNEKKKVEILLSASSRIPDADVLNVLEACAIIMMTDGVISKAEVSEILAFSEILSVEPEYAVLLLLDIVKECKELKIDY